MGDVAIYARYSSHNQRDASIEDQIRVCTEAAERDGLHVVAVYADRARSGRSVKGRTEFLRMVADSADALWDTIYVYKRDRFSRDRTEAAIYRHELERYGVRIVSATEPEVEGPSHIIMDSLLEGLAEYYSANLSQNVRRGMEGNALQCKHNGAHLYGYDLGKDGYYHINEDEAAVVRKAFSIFDAGGSTGDVERALAGHRSRRGARFTKNRISEMLKNEKYAGTYIYGKHRVEGGMEAIVDLETYRRVNERLGKRHTHTRDYMLSGRLYDADGRRFVGVCGTSRNKSRYHYYKVLETGVAYRQDEVESAVCDAVAALLKSDPELVDAIADAVMMAREEAMADELTEARKLRSRLEGIRRETDNIVRTIAQAGPIEQLLSRLKQTEQERVDVTAQLAELERRSPELTRDAVVELLQLIMATEAPPLVVAAFVSRVVIDGDRMTLTFTVSERPKGSHDGLIASDGGEPPREAAGEGPSMAVRTQSIWLRNQDLVRTAELRVNAGGFELITVWR